MPRLELDGPGLFCLFFGALLFVIVQDVVLFAWVYSLVHPS